MNIDAISKIEDAQALLSIITELSAIETTHKDHERLNYGGFLITQLIDKTLIESRELLINTD